MLALRLRCGVCVVVLSACGGSTIGRDAGSNLVDAGPALDGLPNCAAETVSSDAVYSAVIEKNCATSGCHQVPPLSKWQAIDAETFVSAVVNQPSRQVPAMKLIEPNAPTHSYLVWRIMGQQERVGGGLARMPKDKPELSADEKCKIINWINSGAL